VLRAQWSEGIGVMPLGRRVGVVPEQPDAVRQRYSDQTERSAATAVSQFDSVVIELTVLQVRVTVIRTFLLDDHRVKPCYR
jgi:hypothetical protein